VENGHSAEENQVSSTSSSCRSGPAQDEHPAGASSATTVVPQASQYQAGMRCPHQSWREMHQSWMLRIHSW
jgi:hypothetical protein